MTDGQALTEFLNRLSEDRVEAEHPYTDRKNRDLVAEGERPCPICGERMSTDRSFEIALDVCDAHGVWFDRDEIQFLLKNPPGSDFRKRIKRIREVTESEKTFLDLISNKLSVFSPR